MAVHDSPTLLRRLLGRRFREMREFRGETAAHVAKAVGIDPSNLSRFENGRRTPAPLYVRELCKYFGMSDGESALLLDMADASRQAGWWESYPKASPLEAKYISYESAAETIQNFEVAFIPGLLQTREYAVKIYAEFHPEYSERQISDRVDARMKRKRILDSPGFSRFHAVIDAVVFERPVGGDAAMRDQLAALAEAADREKVTLQVIPVTAGAYRGMGGGFSILSFADDGVQDEFVYAEGALAMLYQEDQIDIEDARDTFRSLSAVAASPEESAAIIRTKIAEYEKVIEDNRT